MSTQRYSTRLRLLAPAALALGAMAPIGRVSAQRAADDPLRAMLALAPAPMAEGESVSVIAAFADIAAQTEKLGVARPDGIDDADEVIEPWLRALESLYVSEPFLSRSLQLTRDLIGFDLTDVDQTLEVGAPPEMLTILRGRFDQSALETAWTALGYELLDVGGVRVASLFPTPEIDFENDFQRIVLSRLNNAALLEDGTLLYASSVEIIMAALATAAGEAPSLADRVDIAALLDTAPETFASAALVTGVALAGITDLPGVDDEVEEEVMESQAGESEAMPPISLALLGFTPGGPLFARGRDEATPEPFPKELRATILIYALMTTPGTAADAVEVAVDRLANAESMMTRQRYADFFEDWDGEAVGDGQVMRLELIPARPPRIIWQLLFARDLGFLAW